MRKFRTKDEEEVGASIAAIFDSCIDSTETKIENFPKYVRRQHLKRFLALYEIFKLVLPIKGSIVEAGVFRGFGVMAWAKLSAMLEPENLTRRVYGFDTFAGFPEIADEDRNQVSDPLQGGLQADSFDELMMLIEQFDKDRFLGHIDKVQLIRGDVCDTMPRFVDENRHLVVSLLFLDLDLYDPTKVAIQSFLPRMPKGAVIAFDELDNPMWPGETMALMDELGIGGLEIRRHEWDPYIGYAVL